MKPEKGVLEVTSRGTAIFPKPSRALSVSFLLSQGGKSLSMRRWKGWETTTIDTSEGSFLLHSLVIWWAEKALATSNLSMYSRDFPLKKELK